MIHRLAISKLPIIYRMLYTVLISLLWPVWCIAFMIKKRHVLSVMSCIRHTLGLCKIYSPKDHVLMIHAVSLGETLLAIALIEKIKAENPLEKILLTTTTLTAYHCWLNQEHALCKHAFLPLDQPWIIKPFLRRNGIKQLMIIERELWPNLMACCEKLNITSSLINARLNAGSHRQYQKIKPLMQPCLDAFDRIIAQNKVDADRLADLCTNGRHRIDIILSLKYDAKADIKQVNLGKLIAEQCKKTTIILAASTHDNEEAMIIEAFNQAYENQHDAILLILPRHPERFDDIINHIDLNVPNNPLVIHGNDICPPLKRITLLPYVGCMWQWYTVADIAIIGGSFIPHGGHNPIEPALVNTSIITGPHHDNFASIYGNMMDQNACLVAKDIKHLTTILQHQLIHPSSRKLLADNAYRHVISCQGSQSMIVNYALKAQKRVLNSELSLMHH